MLIQINGKIFGVIGPIEREKPVLVIREGNTEHWLASFRNEAAAERFEEFLKKFAEKVNGWEKTI